MASLEFETELRLHGQIIFVHIRGGMETNGRDIVAIGLDTWDNYRRRWNDKERQFLVPGEFFEMCKATLRDVYEEEIHDAWIAEKQED